MDGFAVIRRAHARDVPLSHARLPWEMGWASLEKVRVRSRLASRIHFRDESDPVSDPSRIQFRDESDPLQVSRIRLLALGWIRLVGLAVESVGLAVEALGLAVVFFRVIPRLNRVGWGGKGSRGGEGAWVSPSVFRVSRGVFRVSWSL